MAKVFSTPDARVLKKLIRERKDQSQHRPTEPPDESQLPSSGSYIVLLDEDLPAAEFDEDTGDVTLGESYGYAYRRDNTTDQQWSQLPDKQPDSSELIPVRDLNNDCVMKRVYNSTGSAYSACSYIECVQDTYGDLYVSSDALAVTVLTTTTSFPEFGAGQLCLGECKYIWDEPTNHWVLDTNGCNTSTTTTSTTTTTGDPTSTSTTSTTPPCICGDPKVQGTSTTTTTPTVCECTYPQFCGEVDGDCTYTHCATFPTEPQIDCTSTTTSSTTCDCNTTSTTTPRPGCQGSCQWVALPREPPGVGWEWKLTDSGCDPSCPCPQPQLTPFCNTAGTQCDTTGLPPGQYDPACENGRCTYYWIPSINAWRLQNSDCGPGCKCVEPTTAGEICAPRYEPCQADTGTGLSTTTAGPCANCYTTTSTSTTPGPCDSGCLWQWDGTDWVLESNTCLGNCSCVAPSHSGHETCEVALTPCITQTTSTTSSTTTTTTTTTTAACTPWACSLWCDCPCGDAEWDPDANGGLGGYTCVSDGSSGVLTDRGQPWCAGESGCACIGSDGATTWPLNTPCDTIYGTTGGNASCPPPASCNQFPHSAYCSDTPEPLTTTTCAPTTTTTTTTTTGAPLGCCSSVINLSCATETEAECDARGGDWTWFSGQVCSGGSCIPA